MEDNELIARVRRGDEAAFETLLHRYEKKVYGLCRKTCGNEQDAEEAAQDTFLSVWRAAGSFRAESAFSTWLYRLAVNACLDLLRRRKRTEGGVSLDDEESAVQIPSAAPLPQETAEREELRAAVRAGLARLPEEYRTVLALRELAQRSYEEIAAETALPLGTVKSRISRARVMLRGFLTEDGNFFAPDASKTTERKPKEVNAGEPV